ncbi:unnamed protein product [Urochloa humidicola]
MPEGHQPWRLRSSSIPPQSCARRRRPRGPTALPPHQPSLLLRPAAVPSNPEPRTPAPPPSSRSVLEPGLTHNVGE